MIAAIKRAAAKAANIALFPVAILIAKTTKANKRMIRWAIRKRSRPVYLFALFWAPTTTLSLSAWAIFSVPIKTESSLFAPAVVVAIFMAKKVMALVAYALDAWLRLLGPLRHYRRQFNEDQTPKN